MPGIQTAQPSNYDFGAPSGSVAQVGLFQILRGAKVILTFQNEGSSDVTVTVNVASVLTGPFSVTSTGNNVVAVSAAVVKAATEQTFDVLFRAGQDNYMQVQMGAIGGGRCNMQVRVPGEKCVEPLNWTIGTVAPIQTPTSATV
jgi:hypothetical protein